MGQTAGAGVSIDEVKTPKSGEVEILTPEQVAAIINSRLPNNPASPTVTTNAPQPSTNYTQIHMTAGAGVEISDTPPPAKPNSPAPKYPVAQASPANNHCPANTSANGAGATVITGYIEGRPGGCKITGR